MAGQGTKVATTDYNTIQDIASSVLGKGSSDSGYGQTVLSSAVSASSKITASHWNNVRSDLIRARQHQTGTDISSTLAVVAGEKITDSARSAYQTIATAVYADRLIRPPVGQGTRENLITNQVWSSSWRTMLTQTVTMTFSAGSTASYSYTAADAARFYFNAGSTVEFSASLVGPFSGASNLKDLTWQTMFSQMGTITFKYNATTVSGTGTGSAIGYHQLTTSDQLIFQKLAPAGTYASNKYYIYARKSVDGSQVIFTIQFRDDYAPGGWGVDEYVDGTLTSVVQTYRATGPNVSVPLPSTTGPITGS